MRVDVPLKLRGSAELPADATAWPEEQEKAAPKCAAHVFRYFPLHFRLCRALYPHLARSLSPKIPFSMQLPWVCSSLQFREQILSPPVRAGLSAAGGWGDLGSAGRFFLVTNLIAADGRDTCRGRITSSPSSERLGGTKAGWRAGARKMWLKAYLLREAVRGRQRQEGDKRRERG